MIWHEHDDCFVGRHQHDHLGWHDHGEDRAITDADGARWKPGAVTDGGGEAVTLEVQNAVLGLSSKFPG